MDLDNCASHATGTLPREPFSPLGRSRSGPAGRTGCLGRKWPDSDIGRRRCLRILKDSAPAAIGDGRISHTSRSARTGSSIRPPKVYKVRVGAIHVGDDSAQWPRSRRANSSIRRRAGDDGRPCEAGQDQPDVALGPDRIEHPALLGVSSCSRPSVSSSFRIRSSRTAISSVQRLQLVVGGRDPPVLCGALPAQRDHLPIVFPNATLCYAWGMSSTVVYGWCGRAQGVHCSFSTIPRPRSPPCPPDTT